MDWRQLWDIASAPDNVPIVAMIPLLAFYIYLAWKQAHANDNLIGELETSPAVAKTHHRKTWPFRPGWQKEIHVWPFLLRIEFLAAIIVTIILMIWSITLYAPLEEPANPNLTMNPAKAPWYFLGLQEMLVYFDPWIAGVVMPTLIIFGLMVIPYIDTNPLGSGYYTWKQRKFAIGTFLFGFIVLWVSMIIIGTFIRGPGWQWFWPGQTWDHNRLIYEVNRDLPDIFGINGSWVARWVPSRWEIYAGFIAKGIFGAIVVGGYYAVAGFITHALFRRYNPKDYQRMSLLQYSIMMFFLLTMLALPIKMLIRLMFNIKYVWITPWFNV
jgi:Cytochrome b(C-terminal)/b6/petD